MKNDILSRLEFFRIGLYSVLYKIRQDDCQPESDLDCVGSLQSWLNQHLVDSLISGSPSSEETVLCIHHALQLCVGESKILQCFVLLEDSYNENLVTESLVLIKTLRAIGNVISRPDKDEIVSVLFNRDSSARYSCLSMIINIAVEYNSDLEVISQWCSVMSILASSSGQLKALLGSNGACTSAVGLLDSHKTRPSLVQDVLWCLCSLSANNRNNLMQILAWKGGTEASRVNINSLLQALYKSRSQTNETREHAELLIGWLDIAASSLENVEHQSTSPALLTQLRIKDESIFRYANRNSRNELMLHKAEARFYPLVSKETPQMIVWDTGEQGDAT